MALEIGRGSGGGRRLICLYCTAQEWGESGWLQLYKPAGVTYPASPLGSAQALQMKPDSSKEGWLAVSLRGGR